MKKVSCRIMDSIFVDNLHTGNEEDAKLFDSLSPTEQLADDEIGRTLQSVTDGVDESGFMRPTAKRKVTPRPANTFNVGDRSFVSRGSSGSTDFIIFQETPVPEARTTIGELESSFALVQIHPSLTHIQYALQSRGCSLPRLLLVTIICLSWH